VSRGGYYGTDTLARFGLSGRSSCCAALSSARRRAVSASLGHAASERPPALEMTFYAVIAVAANGGVDELDARPSDALNLAVRVGAPIFVDDDVLEQGAMPAGDLHARLDADADEADHE
jgi:Bifunctional nuclease domain